MYQPLLVNPATFKKNTQVKRILTRSTSDMHIKLKNIKQTLFKNFYGFKENYAFLKTHFLKETLSSSLTPPVRATLRAPLK